MISWLWLIPAFLAGAGVALLVAYVAVVNAGDEPTDEYPKDRRKPK